MADLKIPPGYQRVMPYLIINNATGFLGFIKKVFGAEEKMKVMKDESSEIMHAEARIGDCTIMFGDNSEKWGIQTGAFFIYVEDADESYNQALAAGASSVMEPSDQEYGRTSGVKDPHGVTWWITSVK